MLLFPTLLSSVRGHLYQDLEDARSRIGTFLEHVYNEERLRSALNYQPPAGV